MNGQLCSIPPNEADFPVAWASALIQRAKALRTGPDADRRWSLSECGLAEADWAQVLEWGVTCPANAIPNPQTVVGALLFLALSAAVARTQDGNEALWAAVSKRMNPRLHRSYFGTVDYPIDVTRRGLQDLCERSRLRHQIDMPGKHRYWRTVMLQIGYTPKGAAARLQYWLLGYGVPESIATLLEEGDENGSSRFRDLWWGLQKWQQGALDQRQRGTLLENSWYSPCLQKAIEEGYRHRAYIHPAQLRVEDESDEATLFSAALLRDTAFTLALSSTLPSRFLAQPPLPFRIVVGKQTINLFHDENGSLKLEGGPVKVGRGIRELEVKAYQSGDLIYRQRIELWQEEDDITIFDYKSGKRTRDLATFVAETGHPYVVLTRADVELRPGASTIESANDGWRFHVFPNGLPVGLSAYVEDFPIWTLSGSSQVGRRRKAGVVEIRFESMTRANLLAVPENGKRILSFRIVGRTFRGHAGSLDLSPTLNLDRKLAPAVLEGGELVEVELRIVERFTGMAYRDSSFGWITVPELSVVDGAEFEGRELVVSWSHKKAGDDCWLMLGKQPLRSQPEIVRRQKMRGTGEPLRLRFGLMNEEKERRVKLVSNVIYCGQLERVLTLAGRHHISFREPSVRAVDYEVHVWERGEYGPRRIDAQDFAIGQNGENISVNDSAVKSPLGWAISLEGRCLGSRFHIEPRAEDDAWHDICAGWMEVFSSASSVAHDNEWETLARHLRWWQFPALMKPFREALEERVRDDKPGTFRAWCDKMNDETVIPRDTEPDYVVPFRHFLWRFTPSREECVSLLFGRWDKPSGWFSDEYRVLFTELSFLLTSHPVLLSRLICEALSAKEQEELSKLRIVNTRDLFTRERDPKGVSQVKAQVTALYKDFVECVCHFAGVPSQEAGNTDRLKARTLEELKSWTDKSDLDSMYFQKYVVLPAELMFKGIAGSDDQMQIAIARSPACRAFLVCHLVRKFGMDVTV
jgi:hypothetical protein